VKLAVVGKGGAGKTTTAAVLARTLARRGGSVVALDCDTNPNLGISLGIGEAETERLVAMRDALDEGEEEHAPGWDQLVDRFGSDGPDGVRLAVVTAIQNPDPGCPCCGLSPERLLGSVDFSGESVIADLEAGIGTLTRMPEKAVDGVVVVLEPTPRAIEVGTRAAELAREKALGAIVVVANRVRAPEEVDRVRAAFPDTEVMIVPDDEAIVRAERDGVAPLDSAPDAPAVRALVAVAERISSI
jgi:CO dehydrogenase maturation factor